MLGPSRHRGFWVVGAVLAAAPAFSCGGDSGAPVGAAADAAADSSVGDAALDGTSEPFDASVDADSDAGADATIRDAAGDGAELDAPIPEASVPDAYSSPALLVPGADLDVLGVTQDQQIVYFDPSSQSQTYYAGSLDGGAPLALYALPSTLSGPDATILGRLVFLFGWGNSYVGTLVLWSAAMGQPVTLTTSALAFLYQSVWASDDGSHIAYLVDTSGNGTVASLYAANGDGSGATLVLSNLDTDVRTPPSCFPRLVFRGGLAVLSYCTAADAGQVPMIQAFAVNGWVPELTIPEFLAPTSFNPLVKDPISFPFEVDPDGTRIAAASSSSAGGALQAFPVDGGPGTVLDPSGPWLPTQSLSSSRQDPWSLFYTNDAGALLQVDPGDPAPRVLVDGGVRYFDALSSDSSRMLISSGSVMDSWYSDLSVASTQAASPAAVFVSDAGSPVAADPDTIGHPGPAHGFTTNGAYVLAYTGLARTSTGQWAGHVVSAPVASPGSTRALSTGQTLAVVYLTGSTVLLCDVAEADGGGPNGDLNVFNLETGAPPTRIASDTGTNCDVAPSSDGSWIVFSNQNGPAPGLYVQTGL